MASGGQRERKREREIKRERDRERYRETRGSERSRYRDARLALGRSRGDSWELLRVYCSGLKA